MDNLFKYISKRNEKLTSLSISKIIRRKAEIENIKALNARLQKEEERIRIVADGFYKLLDKQKAEKVIDDYNLFVSLQLFSQNEDCNKRHGVEGGDPIMEDDYFTNLFEPGTDECFYKDHWNEWKDSLPFEGERMCYTLHCLIDHNHLSLHDLLDIDDIWIELKVDYQFYVSVPKVC